LLDFDRPYAFQAHRAAAGMPSKPRRVYDRAFAIARCRWECLRRTAGYRADVRAAIRKGAKSFNMKPGAFEEYCLKEGGVIEPPSGTDARKEYDEVRMRYGLRVIIHYDVALSLDEIADYPIFLDTPHRQPKIKNKAMLRRFAISGLTDLTGRTRRRIFSTRDVDRGPFQLNAKRIDLTCFDRDLAVFDLRADGAQFKTIAKRLGISVDQAKRAWRRTSTLVPNWLAVESHVRDCVTCQAYANGRRSRGCAKLELQLGRGATHSLGSINMPEGQLGLVNARTRGELPARRSARPTD